MPRKPVPGYRTFRCEDCGHSWTEPTRDCLSPSGEFCEECGDFSIPDTCEPHPEWPTDKSGNLVLSEGSEDGSE